MNARLGKKSEDDTCIGRYSKGERNLNGEELVTFCESNDLLLTNTCFNHSQRHLTTWQQDKLIKETGKLTRTRKVIDYIMIENKFKYLLRDARTYSNTRTESDHRLLICRINASLYKIYKKKKSTKERQKKFNTQTLIYDPEKSKEYSEKLEKKVQNEDQKLDWNKLKNIIKETAEEVIGVRDPEARIPPKEYSVEIQRLADERKKLRILMNKTNDCSEIESMRKTRNYITGNIKKELQTIRERNISELVDEIDNAPNDMKMYKAIRALKQPKELKKNIVVFDDNGKSIIDKEERYQAVKNHFKTQLYQEDAEEIEQFIGDPRPLTKM